MRANRRVASVHTGKRVRRIPRPLHCVDSSRTFDRTKPHIDGLLLMYVQGRRKILSSRVERRRSFGNPFGANGERFVKRRIRARTDGVRRDIATESRALPQMTAAPHTLECVYVPLDTKNGSAIDERRRRSAQKKNVLLFSTFRSLS